MISDSFKPVGVLYPTPPDRLDGLAGFLGKPSQHPTQTVLGSGVQIPNRFEAIRNHHSASAQLWESQKIPGWFLAGFWRTRPTRPAKN